MKKILNGIMVALSINSALALADAPSEQTPTQTETCDCFEPFNRAVTAFNDLVDGLVLEPLAGLYDVMTTDTFKEKAQNILTNVSMPYTFINAVLQGEPEHAGQSLLGFMLNSSFGLGGLFDVATDCFEIEKHNKDFGQTMACWGFETGSYLVLPFLGPSNIRDAVGKGIGAFLDPMSWILLRAPKKSHIGYRWFYGYKGWAAVHGRARAIPVVDYIRGAPDPYVRTRDLYSQNRTFEINNGDVDYDSPSPDNE